MRDALMCREQSPKSFIISSMNHKGYFSIFQFVKEGKQGCKRCLSSHIMQSKEYPKNKKRRRKRKKKGRKIYHTSAYIHTQENKPAH